jgi:hypothetical protein
MMIAMLMLMADVSFSSFTSGKDLVAMCRADRPACRQYIEGASDMITGFEVNRSIPWTVCTGASVTGDQLVDVTTKFLAGHPDSLDQGAGGLIWAALYDAWPCPH